MPEYLDLLEFPEEVVGSLNRPINGYLSRIAHLDSSAHYYIVGERGGEVSVWSVHQDGNVGTVYDAETVDSSLRETLRRRLNKPGCLGIVPYSWTTEVELMNLGGKSVLKGERTEKLSPHDNLTFALYHI